MKKRFFPIFCVVMMVCISLAAGCAAPAAEPTPTPTEQPQSQTPAPEKTAAPAAEPSTEAGLIQIPAPSLANNIVDEPLEQEIYICLPADYAQSEAEYPVMYYLPGFGTSALSYGSMLEHHLAAEVEKGNIEPMIIVTVNGVNRFGGSFFTNSPVTGNWADFLAHDVVDYIDAHYRTIARPESRALAGHSMGGWGAIWVPMEQAGIFAHVYSMSPGLFAEGGLEQSLVSFAMLSKTVESMADMDDAQAREWYLTQYYSWPSNFSYAYGSAFSPDAQGRAPYMHLPEKDADGNFMHDEAWESFEAGYGALPEKLDQYGHNLKALTTFVIDYGDKDTYKWIPEGCRYFGQELEARGIPHKVEEYDGDHTNGLNTRLRDIVLPLFSEAFQAAAG